MNNTAIGYSALTANTTGQGNTALGNIALDANTTGTYNSAVGINALGSITTGSYNTSLGNSTGTTITTGIQNTCIGSTANVTGVAAANQTAVGFGATSTVDNQAQIGNTSVTDVGLGVLHWFTGAGAPGGGLGNTGDGYSDRTAGELYVKVAAVGWKIISHA